MKIPRSLKLFFFALALLFVVPWAVHRLINSDGIATEAKEFALKSVAHDSTGASASVIRRTVIHGYEGHPETRKYTVQLRANDKVDIVVVIGRKKADGEYEFRLDE